MFELFQRARWDQAYDYMASGDPPMIARLLAINTVFFILYIIRKVQVEHKMRDSAVIQVQALLVVANILILFQRDIQNLLNRII